MLTPTSSRVVGGKRGRHAVRHSGMADARGPSRTASRSSSGGGGGGPAVVQSVAFSLDGRAFAAGLASGFTVHESTTKKLAESRGGGVNIVKLVASDAEWVYHTPLLARARSSMHSHTPAHSHFNGLDAEWVMTPSNRACVRVAFPRHQPKSRPCKSALIHSAHTHCACRASAGTSRLSVTGHLRTAQKTRWRSYIALSHPRHTHSCALTLTHAHVHTHMTLTLIHLL